MMWAAVSYSSALRDSVHGLPSPIIEKGFQRDVRPNRRNARRSSEVEMKRRVKGQYTFTKIVRAAGLFVLKLIAFHG